MRRILLLAAALLLAGALPGAARADLNCPIPEDFALDGIVLPATARVVAAGKPLRIVAFGAGSTAGRAASDPLRTYPARLQARLTLALPAISVEVLNKGVPGQDLSYMLARLNRDVIQLRPALVIWDVGTNDAVRARPLDDFTADLETGLARLRAAGIDVILMDMQYAPSTVSIIDFAPYLQTLERVADLEDVTVFQRFEIMRSWTEQGIFDYDQLLPDKRRALARDVYDCLAEGLASGIAGAAKAP